MNGVFENLVRRLRPIVGSKGWDYCIVWKLSENQRFVEWMGCCCGGSERININEDGGEEEVGHCHGQSQMGSCRDVMIHHPNSKSCQLLSQLPSSIPLTDSGIHAQTLISNRPSWLNFSHNLDSDQNLEGTIGTRVLVPVIEGLIELFVAKQVYEDQNVIDFVISQCNISMEQEALIMNSRNMDPNFQVITINNLQYSLDELESKPFPTPTHQNDTNHQPVSSATENCMMSSLAGDNISIDRLHLCSPDPMDLLQQFNYSNSDHKMSDAAAFFELHDDQSSFASDKAIININPFKLDDSNKLQDNLDHHETSTTKDHHHHHHHHHQQQQQGNEIKHENGRSDSISDCSDQNDDEDMDAKNRRGNGKGHQAKNLVAERKRRKKLNDRLYALRVLVPKISKLDKASILGDAIEYVQELQKQAKELQDELEAQHESDDDDDDGDDDGMSKRTGVINGNDKMINESEIYNQHGMMNIVSRSDQHVKTPSSLFHAGASSCINNNDSHVLKENLQDSEITNDKGQQMEPQVEVSQIDGNEFFVKVFCEQKHGGFTRLLEALDCLGLEVTNANVTSFRCLVSNVFQVKKRESEMVEADDVRESLLEVTRNQCQGWLPEMAKTSRDHHHYHHTNFLIQNHHLHHYHN